MPAVVTALCAAPGTSPAVPAGASAAARATQPAGAMGSCAAQHQHRRLDQREPPLDVVPDGVPQGRHHPAHAGVADVPGDHRRLARVLADEVTQPPGRLAQHRGRRRVGRRADQHERAHQVRAPDRQLDGDLAAERVAEHRGGAHPRLVHPGGHHAGVLLGAQRPARRAGQPEAGQVGHVHRAGQGGRRRHQVAVRHGQAVQQHPRRRAVRPRRAGAVPDVQAQAVRRRRAADEPAGRVRGGVDQPSLGGAHPGGARQSHPGGVPGAARSHAGRAA
ncbi:hypothetical protein Sya03_42850 [Spirilliplanes yamanashiensis]|uniref:Uncharacterized protein n=1 Tax=Spirilliplanes yamanashiensis TaxID=42233 RepID=A0A8J4DL31_9ACTN|nr:hypothetical protein [Spirilliplanes yamanashiensis]MDP9818122.1 hypothetical protein [Spirilliplanes yamanashiensis]GIJ04933.1 hypothetical protein Sya03_42850 [Spirilliplanes yamanashiensis]